MAVIKTDTFTVGSDTTLNNHTSDTGGGWQGNQDTAFTALAATDDVQRGSGIATVIGDETNTEADYFAEIEGTMGGTASNDRIGVVMRSDGGATQQSGTSTYYLFRMTGNAGWNLYRVESGSIQTDFTSGTTSDLTWLSDNSIGISDPIKMKMTVEGTGATVTLTLELDFNTGSGFGGYSTVSTVTDEDSNRITSVGDPGMYMRDANARITSFNAEDLTSPSVGDNTTIIVPTGPPLS